MKKFEIGCIYRYRGKVFLACDEKKLCTITGDRLVFRRPYILENYKQDRSLTVFDLCLTWEININEMDLILNQAFEKPEPRSKKGIRSRRRRNTTTEAETMRSLRLVRLARSA